MSVYSIDVINLENHVSMGCNEPEERMEQCDRCRCWLPQDCLQKSEMLGETLCTEGNNSCWQLAKEEHDEYEKDSGYPKTDFK